jgi:GntR family transcriptional regulator
MDPDIVLQVATSDPTPPYEQLRRQLVDMIGSARLRPDQRLPPVRQLAADLGLAAGTVARTYRELESAGLVVTRRGGGTRVHPDLPERPAPLLVEDLEQQMTALVQRARRLGATEQQIRDTVDTALDSAGNAATDEQPAPK